jgi:hypothetical protein
LVTGSAATPVLAQEIAPFRLYDIEGFLSFRTLFDEDSSRFVDGPVRQVQKRPAFEEEIYVLTRSYIYHPNLFDLELGGGPVFVQESYQVNGEKTSSPDTFFNLNARLAVLKEKDYPLVLFYDRRNPRIPLGLAERYFLTDTKYGFDFSYAPLELQIDASRQTLDGSGFNQVTDESLNQLIVRTDHYIPGRGRASLVYQFNRQDSTSGNPQLTIRETRTTIHTLDFTTSQVFGVRELAPRLCPIPRVEKPSVGDGPDLSDRQCGSEPPSLRQPRY